MKDPTQSLFHTIQAQKIGGARTTIQHAEDLTRYTDIFVWDSGVPNASYFQTAIVLWSGVTTSAVIEALKSTQMCCVVACFTSAEPDFHLASPQPLMELVSDGSRFQIHEFWTKGVCLDLLHWLLPTKIPQVWRSITSITLDIAMDTREEQASSVRAFLNRDTRKFLTQLDLLQHLSLSFYSRLPGQDVVCSHAPLQYALVTHTAWHNLESIHLDGFESTAHELMTFLGSHRRSLKELRLRNYFLMSSSWMRVLPNVREMLNLEQVEISGAVEGHSELWLVKTPGYQENCFLSEHLTYWLTHPKADLSCPLSQTNLVWTEDPQEDDWR